MKRVLAPALLAALFVVGAGCTNPLERRGAAPTSPQPPQGNEEPATQDEEIFGRELESPPPSHGDWPSYEHASGFSFQYPQTGTSTWDGSGKLEIGLPNRSLDAAWLELEVFHEAEARELPELCRGVDFFEPNVMTYHNGIPFVTCTEVEGAAGSAYHTFRYVTNRNGVIAALSFTAQTMSDPRTNEACLNGSVTDASCETFNPERDAKIFHTIMETFRWPNPSLYDMTDERITDERSGLSIDIRYPVIMNATFADAFNERIRTNMRDMAEGMRTMYETGYETLEEGEPGYIWTLTIEPTHIYKTNDLVNVFMSGSEYTGGAHPNPLYGSYVFDGISQEFLTPLEYLNEQGINTVDVVNRSRETLLERQYINEDEDWIYTGTEPKDENYSIIKIEADQAIIVFPPYQVGPYAAGPQEITIEL